MAAISIFNTASINADGKLVIDGYFEAPSGESVTIEVGAAENLTIIGTGSVGQTGYGSSIGWEALVAPTTGAWVSGGTAVVAAVLLDSQSVQIAEGAQLVTIA